MTHSFLFTNSLGKNFTCPMEMLSPIFLLSQKVSNNCIIGAKCELNTTEILPNNTVIFGNSNQRHIANEKPQVIAVSMN